MTKKFFEVEINKLFMVFESFYVFFVVFPLFSELGEHYGNGRTVSISTNELNKCELAKTKMSSSTTQTGH